MGLILAGSGAYQSKHKMAQAIAHDAFRSPRILNFDVGVLSDEHAVDRLLGSPNNPLLKSELITAIADNPKRVIVFDEIEKAPPRLLEMIWGLIKSGEVLGAHRQPFQLEQSITLLTTNLGLFEVDFPRNG
jgi:ATP-dependent Clp protease ATP-binding subunit ClpB